MQFVHAISSTVTPRRALDRYPAGLAAALLLGLLAGCASHPEYYRAPVEQRGAQSNHYTQPRSAAQQQPAEAPPASQHGPNYHMAMVAKQMIGVPYRYGGASPSSGFDCSGLIHYSYKKVGLRSPRTTRGLLRHARPVHAAELRTGDILFFKLDGKKVSHAAIYLGNGRMVHAPSSGKRVSYASLSSRFWRNRFTGAGRLF